MFEKHIEEAENFISRLKNSLASNYSDPINDVTNEEFYDWFDNITQLINRIFPDESSKWEKLKNEQREMVQASMRHQSHPLPGYIHHLKRCVQYLNHLETRYKLEKENIQPPDKASNAFELFLQTISSFPKKLRITIFILLIILTVLFIVWDSLPDSIKGKVL